MAREIDPASVHGRYLPVFNCPFCDESRPFLRLGPITHGDLLNNDRCGSCRKRLTYLPDEGGVRRFFPGAMTSRWYSEAEIAAALDIAAEDMQ